MIAVRLSGGLGNQLFEYAAGRALALRHGVPLGLDRSAYERHKGRRYELEAFCVDVVPLDAAELPSPGHSVKSWFRSLGRRPRFTAFAEADLGFDPSVLLLPDWTCLQGYFQSERYFTDHEPAIRRELVLRQSPDGENRAVLDEIAGCCAVSVHVRRGDYVSNAQVNQIHGTVEPGFYRAATELIAERCGTTPTFFVFTDDPDWVAGNLDIGFPFKLVRHNTANQATEDLRLMAACHHQVVANSSFSWWGAWLNPAPDKIVVAPRQWFRVPVLNARMHLPETGSGSRSG